MQRSVSIIGKQRATWFPLWNRARKKARKQERTMHTFDTPAPVSAVLDIPAGRVRFIAADRADTAVEVLPADASKSHDLKAVKQTTVEYGDGVLRIEAAPAQNRLLGASSGAVEVTVRLPAGSRVEAKLASGEFRGVGRLGDVA